MKSLSKTTNTQMIACIIRKALLCSRGCTPGRTKQLSSQGEPCCWVSSLHWVWPKKVSASFQWHPSPWTKGLFPALCPDTCGLSWIYPKHVTLCLQPLLQAFLRWDGGRRFLCLGQMEMDAMTLKHCYRLIGYGMGHLAGAANTGRENNSAVIKH